MRVMRQRGLQISLLAAVTLVTLATGGAARAADKQQKGAGTQAVGPYKDFKGVIKLDVRDSKAHWGPFTPKKAPAGAPKVDDGGSQEDMTP